MAIEHGHLYPFIVDLLIYPLKMMMFHSHVSLPEGNYGELGRVLTGDYDHISHDGDYIQDIATSYFN